MYDSTFTPKGQTVLIGTAVLQAPPTNPSEQCTSYRVRCLVTGYLTWANSETSSAAAPTLTAAAPTAGNPVTNTLGMTANGVETLSLPSNCWFKSSNAAGFEVTPGEGV